ncbi:hypothetical protein E2L07_02470 [Halalkalibacterium halodurans]|nr:hypothetical protein E2L07_02470 [Halalkalibacterium halodurans]
MNGGCFVKIIVTESAKSQLDKLELGDRAIRIVARDTYECSTMIEFYLAYDHVNQDDHVQSFHEMTWIYDEKAAEEIGEEVKVDFVPSQGFKLINRNQTLAYGQSIRTM